MASATPSASARASTPCAAALPAGPSQAYGPGAERFVVAQQGQGVGPWQPEIAVIQQVNDLIHECVATLWSEKVARIEQQARLGLGDLFLGYCYFTWKSEIGRHGAARHQQDGS
jgi:hypothetical protein